MCSNIAEQIITDLIFITSLCVIGIPATINYMIVNNNPAVRTWRAVRDGKTQIVNVSPAAPELR